MNILMDLAWAVLGFIVASSISLSIFIILIISNLE
jgi:hypothetical protein